jgi:hypothetical protein
VAGAHVHGISARPEDRTFSLGLYSRNMALGGSAGACASPIEREEPLKATKSVKRRWRQQRVTSGRAATRPEPWKLPPHAGFERWRFGAIPEASIRHRCWPLPMRCGWRCGSV